MKKIALAWSLLAAPALAHNGVLHDPNLPAPTKAQIHEVADAVQRYRDFAVAEREGWKKFGDDEPLMGEHWYLPGAPEYLGGDARIDFRQPSNLMYTMIGGRRVLTGVAFTARIAPGERVPEGFAGDADHWHIHDFEKAIDAALQDRPILRWLANGWINDNYRSKGDNRGRVAMVHAWVTLPNPSGIFADSNPTIPYLKLGLPAAYADGVSTEAAMGVNMATEGGCNALIDGRLWIANASKTVSRGLHGECEAGAAAVRAALPQGPRAIAAAGLAAQQRFEAAWHAALTPAQLTRISAMGEHGEHGAGGRQSPTMPGMDHDHGTHAMDHGHH